MAFIGESRKSEEHPWKLYVCLDEKESGMLIKAVGKVEGQCLRSLEYFKGKLESGEASEKDTDRLSEAEEDFETICSIKEALVKMIKKKTAYESLH